MARDSRLAELGRQRRNHLDQAASITAQMQRLVRTLNANGTSESQLAVEAGVDRMTIRKWLGK